ncbi:LacI family DNA-binding transcriptional regulator [Ruania albidiflava]|uniref:LacI family DNA-binding transcriptional regulator n=1 Tax=Ruania albidiflava TaxID=366586 RepID=UPI0003B6967D|nr:LacI family DNA-binding transcriptional regulator [Ruania albidiflava]
MAQTERAAPAPTSWRPEPGSRQAEVLTAVTERGTIRVTELAAELGVTPVTVRRDVSVLADAGLVRRVHGGATATNVLPPAIGAAVGARHRVPVGMLVPSLDYYWPDVARGAEEEARRLGLRITLRGSVYHSRDERADVQRLVDSGARGLLLAPTMDGPGGERIRRWLADAPVPAVLMERRAVLGEVRRSAESVVTDHAGGSTMAVHYLASLGHRKIGLAFSQQSPHVHQIRAGWLSSCGELGLPTEEVVDLPVPDRRDPGFDEAIEACVAAAVSTGTTALLVHSDPEAVRIVQRAEEQGLDVPGDLSVLAYDDQIATLTSPALSAVRPPRRTIGRTATALLAARLAEPDRPVHCVRVSPTLKVRDSSGPPRAR